VPTLYVCIILSLLHCHHSVTRVTLGHHILSLEGIAVSDAHLEVGLTMDENCHGHQFQVQFVQQNTTQDSTPLLVVWGPGAKSPTAAASDGSSGVCPIKSDTIQDSTHRVRLDWTYTTTAIRCCCYCMQTDRTVWCTTPLKNASLSRLCMASIHNVRCTEMKYMLPPTGAFMTRATPV
jgi:hypothetical protein